MNGYPPSCIGSFSMADVMEVMELLKHLMEEAKVLPRSISGWSVLLEFEGMKDPSVGSRGAVQKFISVLQNSNVQNIRCKSKIRCETPKGQQEQTVNRDTGENNQDRSTEVNQNKTKNRDRLSK